MRFVVILSIFSLVSQLTCDEYSDVFNVKKLRSKLISNVSYDKFARPVKNHTTQTVVKLFFVLNSILNMDISQQMLIVDARIYLSWKDEYLTWDPAKFGDIKRTFFDFNEIWKPDLILWNYGVSLTRKDDFDKPVIRVNNEGIARTGISDVLKVRCPFDLTLFPYDTQRCDIWFTSLVYTGDLVNITYYNTARCAYGPIFVNKEFSVNNVSCQRYEYQGSNVAYNSMRVTIKFSRQIASYKYYIFLPYSLATIFAITLFLLPINSSKRFIFGGMSTFILLALLYFLGNYLGFQSLGTPYAVKCISLNLLLVIMALIFTIIVSQLLIKSGQYFPLLPRVLSVTITNPIITRLLFVSTSEEMDDDEEPQKPKDTEMGPVSDESEPAKPTKDWLIITRIVDRILFIVYVIIVIAFHT